MSEKGKKSKTIITTTLQLRVCYCIIKLTEIKLQRNEDGWFYKTDLMNLVKAKYSTIDGYLQKLKKSGLITYLSHVTKPDWAGGALKLTARGEREIKMELEKSLSFEDVDKSLKKIQPLLQ